MKKLSNNQSRANEDIYITRLVQYLDQHRNDDAFVMKQMDDCRFYLKSDKSGYEAISFVYPIANVCSEDKNSKGYVRVCYKGQKILKHRLIYKVYGYIPNYVDYDSMVVHHKNMNKLDNRIENLYMISYPNHKILHKYIDKYGIDNIEL